MNSTYTAPKPAAILSCDQPRPVKLLDQVRDRIRYKHYSIRTEQAYVDWIRLFVRHYGLRHPRDMGAPEVEGFLRWLVSERSVAPSTHAQALSALLFLYREVLATDLPWMNEIGRPKQRERVPVVLSRGEVARLLAAMDGVEHDLAQLLYGTGMRLMEALRLRVKDVDFDRHEITVREGKREKDSRLMLAATPAPGLDGQMKHARTPEHPRMDAIKQRAGARWRVSRRRRGSTH